MQRLSFVGWSCGVVTTEWRGTTLVQVQDAIVVVVPAIHETSCQPSAKGATGTTKSLLGKLRQQHDEHDPGRQQ